MPVQHLQYFRNRGPVHFPQGDFLAAELCLETYHSQNPYQRDYQRQHGRNGNQAVQFLFFLIQTADAFVKEPQVDIVSVDSRVEFLDSIPDILECPCYVSSVYPCIDHRQRPPWLRTEDIKGYRVYTVLQRLEIEVFDYADYFSRTVCVPLKSGTEFQERELEHGLLVHDECPVRVEVIGRGEIAPFLDCHPEKVYEIRSYRKDIQLDPMSVELTAPSHFPVGDQPVAGKSHVLYMRILHELLLETVCHPAYLRAADEFYYHIPFESHVLVLHERSLHLDV